MFLLSIDTFNLPFETTIIIMTILTVTFLGFYKKFNLISLTFMFLIILKIGGLNRFILDTYGTNLLTDIVTISLIILLFFKHKRIYFTTNEVKLIFILFLFGISYILMGSINSNAILIESFLVMYISNVVFFLITIFVYKVIGAESFLDIIKGFSIFFPGLTIYQWIIESSRFNIDNYFLRGDGLLGNANLAGATLLVILIVVVYGLTKKIDVLNFIILINVVAALLITQSRSAILVGGIIAITVLLFSNKSFKKKIIVTISFFLVSIVSFTVFFIHFPSYSNRIDISNDDFDNSRLDALYVGLKELQNSFFGTGIGNTSNNFLNLSSHNFYIHFLSEAGIFILPLATFVFLTLIWYIKSGKSFPSYSIYYLIFIILIGFFTHIILINPLYYFVIALVFIDILKEREYWY